MANTLKLTENEKRDIIKYLELNKPLPEKYRFLLFDADREVELLWNGKTDEVENTVLPFQTIEHIDEPRSDIKKENQMLLFDQSGRQIKGWTNKLIWGDNKLILSSLKNGPLRKQIEAEGGLKLIYIDPPFDVGADFSMDIEIGEESFTKKPSVIEEIAYRDTWGKGTDSFISMIYERLKLMHGLLADDGSIYVHCDWRVNSYMRLIMDEIFGTDNFKNEIIWRYRTYQGQVQNYFPRKHDTILFYKKGEPKFELLKDNNFENNIDFKRWNRYLVNGNEIRGNNYPVTDSRFDVFVKKWKKEHPGQEVDENAVLYKLEGLTVDSVWDLKALDPKDDRRLGYPTQKPDEVLERIILASSNEGDLVADFFCGSGTTLAVAEKLGRKWIGSDLGRFAVHTTRKRMIGIQRDLKKEGNDFRAFEILNIGKYEREKFLNVNENLRDEEKRLQREQKEKDFIKLILSAYKAEEVNSFNNFVGKKRDRLVAVGQMDSPVTNAFLEEVIKECKEKDITKVDILGFDYEMGIDFANVKQMGLDIQFKVIPREVFDKKAVEKGQVKFYDVAYIEIKPIIKGKGSLKEISVELLDFSVFYNQDNIDETEDKLKINSSKIIIENGQVVKINKDKNNNINREILTKKWTDWVDYWSVDFDFESKKEFIRVIDEKTNEEKEQWTGSYIFENEWQSFRTKKDRTLQLISASREVSAGKRKIAVKVIDIFGNDTTKTIEVNI